MLVTTLSIFFLWAHFDCVSLGMVHDGAAEVEQEQSSVLQKRLDTIERLLSHHMAKQSELENLLQQEKEKTSKQAEIQQRLLYELSEHKNLLDLQQSELFRHKQLLSHYGHLFQQPTAHTQDTLLLIPNGNSLSQGYNSRQAVPVDTLQSSSETSDKESRLAFHDVTSRSDDSDPLEVVVNGHSQQVTEMRADVQALKAQRQNEFQTLTAQTQNDIQALKAQTQNDFQTLKTNMTQQEQNIQDAQSSTFVHWGSFQCSTDSELVYSGVVGGSYWGHTGAATNFLCLTMSPVVKNLVPPAYTYIYGAEYETGDSYRDKDPVCAVCRSAYTTTVMIPGTNACTLGWHLQYSGFLMAGNLNNNAGSEFICVDSDLESRIGGDQYHGGRMLLYTITQCGSLPCAPYVNRTIVLCAVCSK